MMIILNELNEANQRAGQFIRALNLEEEGTLYYLSGPPCEKRLRDKNCYILALNENLSLTQTTSVKDFAKALLKLRLPTSLEHIYLITSDLSTQHSLLPFASHLSLFFKEFYQRDLKIHVVCDLNYDLTILRPPSENSSWMIFGKQENSGQEEKLLWQGENILQWFNDPQRVLSSKTYATWGDS